MIKNLHLYVIIVATVLVSLFVASIIMMSAFFWSGPLVCILGLFYGIPALVAGFIIFIMIQKTNLSKYVNAKNTIILCIIIGVIIIGGATYFSSKTKIPYEIVNWWYCDSDQALCTNESCSILMIDFDYTYGYKTGRYYEENIAGKGERRFDFDWNYDHPSKIITIFCNNESSTSNVWSSRDNETGELIRERLDWEVKLRLDVTSSQKMTTYYISDKDAPFNAELFDGITWSGKWSD